MAINPLVPTDDRAVEINPAEIEQPSLTYQLDFKTGKVRRPVDGRRALRQFVRMTLQTERFRYLIYDGNYGSELHALISEDLTPELLRTEIPRVIREALTADNRIRDVINFEINRDRDAYFVTFEVVTADGTFTEEMEVVT